MHCSQNFFSKAKQKQNCQKAKAWNAIKSLQIDWIYYWKFFFSQQRHTNLQSPRATAMLSLLPDPITRRLRQQSWSEPNFAFYFWLKSFWNGDEKLCKSIANVCLSEVYWVIESKSNSVDIQSQTSTIYLTWRFKVSLWRIAGKVCKHLCGEVALYSNILLIHSSFFANFHITWEVLSTYDPILVSKLSKRNLFRTQLQRNFEILKNFSRFNIVELLIFSEFQNFFWTCHLVTLDSWLLK